MNFSILLITLFSAYAVNCAATGGDLQVDPCQIEDTVKDFRSGLSAKGKDAFDQLYKDLSKNLTILLQKQYNSLSQQQLNALTNGLSSSQLASVKGVICNGNFASCQSSVISCKWFKNAKDVYLSLPAANQQALVALRDQLMPQLYALGPSVLSDLKTNPQVQILLKEVDFRKLQGIMSPMRELMPELYSLYADFMFL